MNYKVFDDAILLKLLKAGDGSALEEIYVRYSEMVFLAALKKVKSKAIAEELVQNLFISLWVKRETAQIQHLPSYLQSAVRYQVIDYIRVSTHSRKVLSIGQRTNDRSGKFV